MQEVQEHLYRTILETAQGTKTQWDKKQKVYTDENGISQVLISYNDLLRLVKQAMMSGTTLQFDKAIMGLDDKPLFYRALKFEDTSQGNLLIGEYLKE